MWKYMYIHAYTYWHRISGTTIFMNIAIVQSNLVLPLAWLRAESHPAKPWLRASWAKSLAHSSDSAAKWVERLWVALSHSSRFIISIYGNNICPRFPSSVAQKQVPMLVWGVCDTLWVLFFTNNDDDTSNKWDPNNAQLSFVSPGKFFFWFFVFN